MKSYDVTFSTCWYNFKKKFDNEIYYKWIDNMLSNVNHYYLVIYSDEDSCGALQKYMGNPRIRLVLKPHQEFHNYKYVDHWIRNHEKNAYLNTKVDWKVNMLWAEKTHFVYETMTQKYFDTDYYGWCDIGYFRGGRRDLSTSEIRDWCSPQKIAKLNPEKIYYALVNNNSEYISELYRGIQDKNAAGLPKTPIPPFQISVAGGFFVSHNQNIEWWRNTFDERLSLYFQNDYLVKDDQIIVVDCVFTYMKRFCLCKEDDTVYDNWFLFQRFLS